MSFYINRSKICTDESAHAASLGEIGAGSWSPFGAVPCLCLKIGMETFQIISMEHKISQARLALVKSKNQ